jgi:hypothetical protein
MVARGPGTAVAGPFSSDLENSNVVVDGTAVVTEVSTCSNALLTCSEGLRPNKPRSIKLGGLGTIGRHAKGIDDWGHRIHQNSN